jgi:hypothetical protein
MAARFAAELGIDLCKAVLCSRGKIQQTGFWQEARTR